MKTYNQEAQENRKIMLARSKKNKIAKENQTKNMINWRHANERKKMLMKSKMNKQTKEN